MPVSASGSQAASLLLLIHPGDPPVLTGGPPKKTPLTSRIHSVLEMVRRHFIHLGPWPRCELVRPSPRQRSLSPVVPLPNFPPLSHVSWPFLRRPGHMVGHSHRTRPFTGLPFILTAGLGGGMGWGTVKLRQEGEAGVSEELFHAAFLWLGG